MQKLFQMNSEFMTARAKALAARFDGEESCVKEMYDAVYYRAPDADELAIASEFLKRPTTGKLSRREQFAQSLLISNELMYVD